MNIAITGHRPQDLGHYTLDDIQTLARHMVRRCAERWPDEPLIFHTGAAIGVDLWVAQAIVPMGAGNVLHPPLMDHLIGDQRGWTQESMRLYQQVRDMSDSICMECPGTSARYQRRNMHMVDSSRLLIAYWSGKPRGGTYDCIQYARRMDVPVLNALDGFRRI